MQKQVLVSLITLVLYIFSFPAPTQAKDFSSSVRHKPSKLTPKNVGVIYNAKDPNSLEIAKYYLEARKVPERNLIKVELPVNGKNTLNFEEFNQLKQSIDKQLNPAIQVLLIVWSTPYQVGCGSITSALTFGEIDAESCRCDFNNEGLKLTFKQNPYFNSRSLAPLADYNMRLSMLLPIDSVALAKSVIDRGILSEFTLPEATGYFIKGTNSYEKPRMPFYPLDFSSINLKKLKLRTPSKAIMHKKDIMFYFIGAPNKCPQQNG